ncbi:hypothetical protein D3C81_2316180 [compost metagenome]
MNGLAQGEFALAGLGQFQRCVHLGQGLAGNVAEIAFDQGFYLAQADITDDDQGRVVGGVPALVPLA